MQGNFFLPKPIPVSHSKPAPLPELPSFSNGLTVLLGPQAILRLYPWLVSPLLLIGESIMAADGGNGFNPYDFAKLAERAGIAPREILARIHVSRAFTCHQMLALVGELPRFTRKRETRVILLPGLLDTFYDEAIPAPEAKRLWRMTLTCLRRLADEFLLLAVCPEHPMEAKRTLQPSLSQAADRVVVLSRNMEGALSLRLEKPQESRALPFTLPEALSAVWSAKEA